MDVPRSSEASRDPVVLEHPLGVIQSTIRKISLYNFDLLKPHFYIVKLGFTGVYIIFAKKLTIVVTC